MYFAFPPRHATAWFRWTVFSALLVLISTALPAQEIIKSPSDSRQYRAVQLDNGMKVILVSDPQADFAAVSLSVNVGSSANPPQWQGLAHFLEHMLFLGTEKYPQPGEYKDFIVRNGGSDNAYTAFDETNYYFRIQVDKLAPAMDRFAQFFIAPLFNPEYVDRERQVVNSEYLGRKKSDGRGIFSASRAAMNPEHPNSRFSVGNLTTLGDRPGTDVRDSLVSFYQRYYSANLMTLTVLGNESVAELETWVREIFSAIPNRQTEVPGIDVPMYLPGALPARLQVQPQRRQQRLSLSFPVPAVRDYWRTKPVQYIAQLLGHEGKGSLLATLKERGWAQGLSAGLGFEHPSGASVSIDIQLTPAGLENQDAILALVFAEIDLIRKQGIQRWIFDETRRLAEIDFRFLEKPAPLGLVRRLSSLQHQYPAEEVLRGPYLYADYRPQLIADYLDRLTPDNLFLTVVAKDVQTNAVSRWYETPYRLDSLSSADQAPWRESTGATALSIPEPNPFIPEKLDMLAAGDSAGIPVPQLKLPGLLLYHQQDTEFALPKASFFFSLRMPSANDSPRHSILTELYVDLVNDQLNEYAYPAALAGLGFQIYPHMRGISVRITGYADRQSALLKRILETLTRPALNADRFKILKAEAKRSLLNRRRNQPYSQALSGLRDLVLKPRWTDTEQLAIIDTIGIRELRSFVPKLLSRMDVVALAHGNINVAQARRMGRQIQSALVEPARVTPVARGRVLRLKRNDRIVSSVRVDHPESATVLYYQTGIKSLRQRVLAAMTSLIISPPMFDELRTEKKLGYVVFANNMPILEVPGLAFIVQSPSTTSAQLQTYMQDFIRGYGKNIDSLSESRFAQHKQSMLSRVLKDENRLGERSHRYWNEIDRNNPAFDTRTKIAETVRDLKLAEFKAFYKKVLLDPDSRLVTVKANGDNTPPNDPQAPARNATAVRLQQTHGYFPAN